MLKLRRLCYGVLMAACTLFLTPSVFAHDGGTDRAAYAPGLSELLLLTAVLLTGWLYTQRIATVWRRVGKGRGVAVWRLWLFWAALLVLAIALASPLEAWSGQLFSAHMVQHVLLMQVAAPLLVLGLSPAAATWVAPATWRRPLAKRFHRLTHFTDATYVWPLAVWLLYAVVFWFWHIPAMYEAALAREWIHYVEHGAFLGTAVLFWWTLAYAPGGRRTSVGLLFVFTTALHSGLLGVLLTFSRSPWYPTYATSPLAWGLTPLADQQLGGAIMWVFAGVIYLIAVLVLLHIWFSLAERREQWAV